MRCANKDKICGILTPNITPVDALGRIDEDKLRGYVDWLIEHGVDGLYPNGSTGEFVRFTAEERRRIAAVVLDQAAGRVPVLVGAAEANVHETIDACDAYGALGARAVAIVAPFYYRVGSEAVYAYFREIAKSVQVDVTLYNIPLFASPIDVDTVRRLAEDCPRVIGIKDSSGDLPHMMRMIAAVKPLRADFSFLTGWDAALAPMLMAGADGGTNATSGVVPELTAAIYNACQKGDTQEAMQLQYQLLPLFDAMIGVGEFPEGFRAGMRARGWDLGPGRQPATESHRQQSRSAEEQVTKMLQQAGVALSPPQAEPVAPASLDAEHIDAIVRRVVQSITGR